LEQFFLTDDLIATFDKREQSFNRFRNHRNLVAIAINHSMGDVDPKAVELINLLFSSAIHP
jgi:hypothetical protein